MLKSNMLADGGVMQEGGTVDPVSGNEVPVGSMKEEVRDDIDAKLSEGEFVFPADVVRYWGLEKLMMMRDKAKKGLQRMNDIGQMGNAEEVPDAEALHSGDNEMDDDTFSSEIDSIIGETDAESMGGKREFAAGGFAQPGTDYLAKYNIPKSSISNPALDVRAYKNAEGRLMYITFFNGKPSTPIPEGFKYVGTGQELLTTKPEDVKKPETTTDTTATGTPINDGQAGGGSSATGTPSTDADGLATASTVSPTTVAVGLTGLAALAGIPAVASPTGMVTGFVTNAVNSLSHSIAAAANVAATGSPAAVDSHSQASNTAPTATIGSSGTGGAAASAASSAAAAAAAAGHSPAAQAAASQAAADATISGLTAAQAAEQGNVAAVSVSISEGNIAAAEATESVAADAGGQAANSGPAAPGGGEAPSAGAGAGAAGGGNAAGGAGNSGDGGTGDSATALAKGGLVSKRKSSFKSTKQKGLASRK